MVQGNGLHSKTKSSTFKKEDAVKDLPLNSQIALKVMKRSQDEEEPPKAFSIFSLKGYYSKPSTSIEKVEEVKQEESKSDKPKFVFNFKPIKFKCDTSKNQHKPN